MYSFEKLIVWQKAIEFCELIYRETKKFPKDEMFGLVSQLRRAATSIPLNISEGSACSSKREFKHFVNIAQRSQYEIATIIRLSNKLGFLTNDGFTKIDSALDEICRLLRGLFNSLV